MNNYNQIMGELSQFQTTDSSLQQAINNFSSYVTAVASGAMTKEEFAELAKDFEVEKLVIQDASLLAKREELASLINSLVPLITAI